MEYRQLGKSGFTVPVLSFGTATFGGGGGTGSWLAHWGSTELAEAQRMIDICMDAGVTMFDTSATYSGGLAESILGAALEGKRDRAIISTKIAFRESPDGQNNAGSSRHYLAAAVDRSLKRLKTDYIDLLHLHAYDAMTPPEEIMHTLDMLVRAGKIRYSGVSNYSGWHLMRSLAVADRYGYPRHVSNQGYYSLIGRDFEWDGMPLGLEEGVGTICWSPLGWGRLTGKLGRNKPWPAVSRLHETAKYGPKIDDEYLFRVLDALDRVAEETGKTVAQIALNWLTGRPTVSSVVIGARTEAQLIDNLGAAGWALSEAHKTLLNEASAVVPPYPYWHQKKFAYRIPFLARPEVDFPKG